MNRQDNSEITRSSLKPLNLTDEQIEALAQITEQDKLDAQQWSKKRKAKKLHELLTAPPQEKDGSTQQISME